MRLITVSGAKKDIGKTTLASFLIRRFKPCYAIKCSVHPEYGTGFVADRSILQQPGTDTARFLTAGAVDVNWLRSDGLSHCSHIQGHLSKYGDDDLVIAEGNTVTHCVSPTVAIFIAGLSIRDLKPSAVEALAMADIVAFFTEADLAAQDKDIRALSEDVTVIHLGRDLQSYKNMANLIERRLREEGVKWRI